MTALISLFSLRWTLPSTAHTPITLPKGITRSFISTPSGSLELLSAVPSSNSPSSRPPLFFLHGGFGAASVWIPWLQFFQSQGYACYALSLRGHGESWIPGYWRMVWGTTFRELADDAVRGFEEVRRLERERKGGFDGDDVRPVFLGHSSGGGMGQFLLSEGLVRASGLVLCAAVPGQGSMGVYWNWFKLDPWFPLRNWLHLMHPRSPLSSTSLVRSVFFTKALPEADVKEFEHGMPYWESMKWPLAMMKPFVTFPSIVQNITNWGNGRRVCVIAGAEDRIVSPDIARINAQLIRVAVRDAASTKKIEIVAEEQDGGVDFVVVEKAPHHLQNDLTKENAARQILRFLQQLR